MCADVWQWLFKHNFTYDVYLYIFIIYFTCSIPFFLPLIFNFSYHPILSPFLLTAVLSLSPSLSPPSRKRWGGWRRPVLSLSLSVSEFQSQSQFAAPSPPSTQPSCGRREQQNQQNQQNQQRCRRDQICMATSPRFD